MPTDFNPLDHPILFAAPRRLTQYSAWHGHIPFAMLLVELTQPQLLVELGTYYGDSYCAFCQAVQELRLPTQCFAIDTWRGDPQTGVYGNEVMEDLRAHHDPLYGGFSRLIQSTFDDARPRFADGSIDILNIDGSHALEAVRHDFECWLPKMSPRGIVLFHDIHAREKDLRAGSFWDEIKTRYPSLEFMHGCGLGVLAVGQEPPAAVLHLMTACMDVSVILKRFFFHLASSLPYKEQTYRQQIAGLEQTVEEQMKHLDALSQAMGSMTGRVGELHELLIDAQQQLIAQTDEIERFRAREAQLGVQVRQNQDQIRRMMATRVWKVGEAYWHVLERIRSLFAI